MTTTFLKGGPTFTRLVRHIKERVLADVTVLEKVDGLDDLCIEETYAYLSNHVTHFDLEALIGRARKLGLITTECVATLQAFPFKKFQERARKGEMTLTDLVAFSLCSAAFPEIMEELAPWAEKIMEGPVCGLSISPQCSKRATALIPRVKTENQTIRYTLACPECAREWQAGDVPPYHMIGLTRTLGAPLTKPRKGKK